MASIKENNLELNYGWPYGESGWNSGMDENIVKLGFESRKRINGILSSPPSSPSNGDAYLVGTAPTSLFSGKFANIAIYDRGSWVFITPKSQEVVFNTSDGCDYIYNNGWSLKLEAEVSPYIKIKDFTFSTGYTITDQRQCLLNIADNHYYQWNGTLPKVIPAASTPETSGGIGVGAWVARTQETLRSQVQNMVAAASGDAYVKTIKGLLDKWNAAKKRGASNPARFAFVGDSNVAGEGTASGTNGLANANSTNMTKKLASLAGFQSESFLGDKNVTIPSSSLPLYDTRITLGSGWSSDTVASETLGGRFLIASTGASGKLTFTPASPFSKFRLWYPTTTGLNTSLGIYVDNVLIDTINQDGADALTYKDYTVSLGSHSIAIGVGSSGSGYVSGIEILNGSQNPIMFNAGYCGLSTQNMVANTRVWNHRPALVALAPDFTVIYATVNDASNATPVNVFLSNIENIVSDLHLISNGALCVGFPYDGVGATNGLYAQYAEGLRRIADDYGWFYIDSRAVFGNSYKKATARGYSYNAKHPNKAGSDAFVEYLYSLFSSSSM